MRYDTLVTFVKRVKGEYNKETGDYAKSTLDETDVFASVNDTQTSMLKLIYGTLRQGSYTIQLQNHYPDDFDYILIDGRRYDVDFTRRLRHKQTFVVSEHQ